jgi:hypothetical protein
VELTLVLFWTAFMGYIYFNGIEDYLRKEKHKDLSDIVVGTSLIVFFWSVGAALIKWACGWFA